MLRACIKLGMTEERRISIVLKWWRGAKNGQKCLFSHLYISFSKMFTVTSDYVSSGNQKNIKK